MKKFAMLTAPAIKTWFSMALPAPLRSQCNSAHSLSEIKHAAHLLDCAQGVTDGKKTFQEHWPQAAFAALVQQSRQSGHDGALPRTLSELRADQARAHLRHADHRHRADRQ